MVGACARLFFLRVWFERSVRGPLETETGRTVETTVLESTILIGNVIILGVVRPHVRPPVRPHFRPRVRKLFRPRGGRVPAACRSQVWTRPAAWPDTCAGHVSGHTSRFFRAGAPAGSEVSGFDSLRRRFCFSCLLRWFLWARACLRAGIAYAVSAFPPA